ncbi:hypothetical protein GALMADRAFT_931812 [Galerina marginata CBS 339.88]|uniref:G-protein coupled receptors family 1 profile domain-containing protein n=1 Tax=Galerina marginata (strain CBS 339.88) TaxID=685588 RepID=A0A067SEI9_GALM3|nr:hypothetical protein GALMADRAFT_931812 [Galerina marginata CBS 339.88]
MLAVTEDAYLGNFFGVLNGYLVTIALCSMQGIMIYRVSSMYNHQRRIIALLSGSLILEVASLIAIQCISSNTIAPVPEPEPGVHFCTTDSSPYWLYSIWIPIMSFELIILILALSLGIRYYRSIRIIRRIGSSASLPYILLRDSITFPFILVVLCFINLIAWIRLPYLIGEMTYVLSSFAPCIIGSRLILNLREAYYQSFKEECNISQPEDRDERFFMTNGTDNSTS